jgi:predicted esterase
LIVPLERHLTVGRTARYYTLGESAADQAEVWMVLHGYGQLAERFIAKFEPIAGAHRLIVAPEGLSRFYTQGSGGPDSRVGASWMTREDRLEEIADYLRYLDAVYEEALARLPGERRRLHLLGFSQGAATAARWALRGKARVDRLILWAGLLPPDVETREVTERLGALDLVLVAGVRDEWVNAGLPLTQAALEKAGVRYRVVRFSGGHELDVATLEELTGKASPPGAPRR